MVQFTPKRNFNLEVHLCQSTNVQLYQHKVMNSSGTTLWRNNDLKQICFPHYELWNSKVHFPCSLWAYKNTSNLAALDLSHNSKCIPNSGVQDPVFWVQSGRILRIFWIWNGYHFHFNRIRNRIIQMKKNC